MSVAKKYQNRCVQLQDLIAVGNTGLRRAAEKFDPEKGVKFITYAVRWIRQRILKCISEDGREARIPTNRATKINRAKRVRDKFLEAGLSEYAALHAALEETGVDEEIFLSAVGLSEPIPLDAPAHDGDSPYQVIDVFLYDSTEPTYEHAETTDLSDIVKEALKTLEPRDAHILRLYYALDGGNDRTLEQIGEIHGVTRERIRQLKEKTLKRLKDGKHGKALRELCDALE